MGYFELELYFYLNTVNLSDKIIIIFKIIQVYERYDGANKTSSNCSISRAKKLEKKSTTKEQQNLKIGKVRYRRNIRDVRKEDSRLNAIKQLITLVKRGLNFSGKSTTAAIVDLTESPPPPFLITG